MRVAVVRRARHDADLIADLVGDRQDARGSVGLEVQPHVEQRKLDLTQHLQPALEVLRGEHLVEQRARQWLAAVDLRAQPLDDVPFPAVVLHELARQLDRVPLDAADAGHAELVDAGQHVVQPVAEFVQQRDQVVVGEQRGLAADRRREVADQVRDRGLQAAVGAAPAPAHVVHPGPGALAGARVGVEVELREQLAAALDAVEAHVGVPGRRAVGADRDFEDRLDDPQQALEHARLGQVLAHFLVAERVARLLEPLAGVGQVPGLQLGDAELGRGVSAQLGEVALGIGARAPRQVTQEAQHLLGAVGHLGHQRQVRVRAVAEQARLLGAQLEQLAHRRAVVERGIAEIARARRVGTVQLLAQRAVVRVLHQRLVAGRAQRQLGSAVAAVGAGGGACGLADVRGHAGQA